MLMILLACSVAFYLPRGSRTVFLAPVIISQALCVVIVFVVVIGAPPALFPAAPACPPHGRVLDALPLNRSGA